MISVIKSIGVRARQTPGWVWGFATLVMVGTSMPYVVALLQINTGWHFSGFLFGVQDGNSYIAKMRLGAEGEWLFRTPYSVHEQSGLLVYLPYMLLGKLIGTGAKHSQLVLLFHLFRLIAGYFLILSTYKFISIFLIKEKTRKWGLILATLGGGSGWLLVILGSGDWLGSSPLEFYSPESFGFLSLFSLPHLAIARGLFLEGLISLFSGLQQYPGPALVDRKGVGLQAGIQAGSKWLLMGFFQPIDVGTVSILVGVFIVYLAILRIASKAAYNEYHLLGFKKIAKICFTALGIPSFWILYSFWKLISDPYMRVWAEQNKILSPHPLHYLLAYGLMIPFIVMAIRALRQQKNILRLFLFLWVFMLPFLAYAPVNIQRRLPDGIWVCLVCLAVKLFDVPQSAKLVSLTKIAFSTTLVSTIFLFAGSFQVALAPSHPVFVTENQAAAFDYIDKITTPKERILCTFESCNAIPAWAYVKVPIGHGPESIGLNLLQPRIIRFYDQAASTVEQKALLDELQIHYIYVGELDRVSGGEELSSNPQWILIYRRGQISIYRVKFPECEIS